MVVDGIYALYVYLSLNSDRIILMRSEWKELRLTLLISFSLWSRSLPRSSRSLSIFFLAPNRKRNFLRQAKESNQ